MIGLSGMKFWKLTVESFCKMKKLKNTYKYYWHCKCDCGNVCIAEGDVLKRGAKKSCGCYVKEKNIKNMAGKKYGKLTVLSFAESKGGHYYYYCKCECGKTIKTESSRIKCGRAKSCGCLP